MGVHHPYHLDLCADDEDPSQLIIRPGWDAPHVRCFPRTICAWPCLLRQVGTVLGSPYDCVVDGLAYANPRSRQWETMGHPSDGRAWNKFDEGHPEEAAEARHFRVVVSLDG